MGFLLVAGLLVLLFVSTRLRRDLELLQEQVRLLQRRVDELADPPGGAQGVSETPVAAPPPPPTAKATDAAEATDAAKAADAAEAPLGEDQPPAAAPPPLAVAARHPAAAAAAEHAHAVRRVVADNVLAIVGGLLVLVGALLFLSLSISRGWIGETGRVAITLGSGVLLTGLGVWLGEGARKRDSIGRWAFGSVHGVLAGIGVAVLFFAAIVGTRIYDVLGAGGLVVAIAAGAVAVATAIRWRNQDLAGFGIVGALSAPVLVDARIDLQTLAFVAVALVAALAVVAWQDWPWLATAAVVITAPQLATYALDQHDAPERALAVLLAWNAVVALGVVANAVRHAGEGLPVSLASVLTLAAAAAGATGIAVLDGRDDSERALWLAMLCGMHVMTAGIAFLGQTARTRTVAIFVAGLAATFAAAAAAYEFDGAPVAAVLAGEAALFTWLWSVTRDLRAAIAAVSFAVATVLHVLSVDAPVRYLVYGTPDVPRSSWTLAAVIAAAAVTALAVWRRTRDGEGELSLRRPRHVSRIAAVVCAVASVHLGSLLLVTGLGGDPGVRITASAQAALLSLWVALGLVLLALQRGVALGREWVVLAALLAGAPPVWLLLLAAEETGYPSRLFDSPWLTAVATAGFAAAAVVAVTIARWNGRRGIVSPLLATAGAGALAVGAWLAAWSTLHLWAGAAQLPGAFTVGSGELAWAVPTTLLCVAALLVLAVRQHLSWPNADLKALVAPSIVVLAAVAVAVLFVTVSDVVVSAFTDAGARQIEQDAQTALSIVWGVIGVCAYALAATRRLSGPLTRVIRAGSLVLLAVAVGKVVLVDTSQLDSVFRVLVFVALGLLLLVGAYADQRLRRHE